MKIRIKMTLWYTLLTSILLAIFLPILYQTISISLLSSEKNLLQAAMSQTIMNIDYESDSASLFIWNDPETSYDLPTLIWDADHELVYSHRSSQWLFDIPFIEDKMRKISKDGSNWILYDNIAYDDGKLAAKIRICSSLENIEATLRNTLLEILIVVLPIYFLVTILGGLLIAKRALRPISNITALAKSIESSDLSKRITEINCKDEVGELAETFNGMLNHLEQSFQNEKRFASDASHELRTPVSVIMANAEMSLAMEQNTETQKTLSIILNECHHMNVIISQLLMLTRGMEGKYTPKFEQTSLNVIIDTVLEQLFDLAEDNSITLLNTTEKEYQLFMDQSLITQMMLNLVTNAVKYGNHGGHVWINAKDLDGFLIITITDDGIGIDKENLPFLFDRFYRVDKSRDRNGSGLGLSIVKWIVEKHNGKITVCSEIDKGTTFSIILDI